MKHNKTLLLNLLVMFSMNSGFAQSSKPDIRSLSFMSGRWVTKHQWGDMEEYWSAPMGDNMVSTFRCVKDGKILFYEFVVIEQSDSVPVMILRHFKRGSIGWEDKEHPNYFPAVSITTGSAEFRSDDGSIRMVYALVGKDRLDVSLEEKSKEGKPELTSFHYTRQP